MDMYPQHRYLNWFNVIEITFCILSLLPLLGLSALTMLIYVWTVECLSTTLPVSSAEGEKNLTRLENKMMSVESTTQTRKEINY